MKFVAAILTLAAVATAAPAEVVARNDAPKGGSCNINGDNNGKVTCCNPGIPILGPLLCNVLALGNTCNSGQNVYCCDGSSTGGLINVNLSCLKLL